MCGITLERLHSIVVEQDYKEVVDQDRVLFETLYEKLDDILL